MYKRVDEGVEEIEGFTYKSVVSGTIECVDICDDTVETRYMDGDGLFEFYVKDIPNLIKALQAAYDYKKGQK